MKDMEIIEILIDILHFPFKNKIFLMESIE